MGRSRWRLLRESYGARCPLRRGGRRLDRTSGDRALRVGLRRTRRHDPWYELGFARMHVRGVFALSAPERAHYLRGTCFDAVAPPTWSSRLSSIGSLMKHSSADRASPSSSSTPRGPTRCSRCSKTLTFGTTSSSTRARASRSVSPSGWRRVADPLTTHCTSVRCQCAPTTSTTALHARSWIRPG